MNTALRRLADWSAGTPKRLWAVAFALFFTLAGSWAMATPIGDGPDEYAHFIRAAAVARGQIGGPEVMVPHRVAGTDGLFAETGVQLPEWYQQLKTVHECYTGEDRPDASCAPPLDGSEKLTQVTTAAGRYHPAYYLATGWPSLLVDGPDGLYLMRLMSAVLCAALLASAVVTAAEWRRRSPALLGVFAAATPMALFMAGMENPSGGEIAAGILVWTALLSVLMSPDPLLLNRRLARLGIGGLVLINIRPLGLIWFAGALAFGLLIRQRGVVRMVLRRKILWVWTALLVLSAAGSLLWTAAHPDHSVIHVWEGLTKSSAARETISNTPTYITQMLGFFGWLDPAAPTLSLTIWTGVLATLVVLGLSFGRKRAALAVVGMLIAIVLVPAIAQGSQAEKVGMIWQGRYLLPFAVGLPLMCAMICASRAPGQGLPWRRLVAAAATGLAVADAAAFFWTLRRFAVGLWGPWLPLHAHWAPPGGWVLWTVVYTLAAFAVVLPVLVSDRPSTEADGPLRGGRPSRRARRMASIG
ncbi:DUF2142 domain-containing protein [Kitasatospora sp. NPDC049258]|uniref:DUF2142 domain-containing protein n=1 Tax=Kitasatospora sp. NPDC049258 TaxID=3155394 RepID=UPI0034269B72